MDFRQFRYFIATADELHFARAAERLGIAQPALSQQIKALEEQIGARLFNRTKRRVALTEAGAVFLREARTALEIAENAARIARDTARGEAGNIDIGIVGSVMFDPRFPQLLRTYRKAHPGILLSLHEMPILMQIEAVHKNHLDVAIIRDPLPPDMPDDLEYFSLSSQRLMVAMSADHRLSASSSISLDELAGDPFVVFQDPPGIGMGHIQLTQCRKAGFEPQVAQRVAEIATLISLVAAGFGVSLVTDILSNFQLPGVRYIALKGNEVRSDLLVVHRRFERSLAVRELLRDTRLLSN